VFAVTVMQKPDVVVELDMYISVGSTGGNSVLIRKLYLS
jgi:hypothetical protein